MVYESTGEVREPKVGEYYLRFSPQNNSAVRGVCWRSRERPELGQRIIMRPWESWPDFEGHEQEVGSE
jgi:hypothetical protein